MILNPYDEPNRVLEYDHDEGFFEGEGNLILTIYKCPFCKENINRRYIGVGNCPYCDRPIKW